jgi:ADP-heptose:LPS heptosyltransferase
MIQPQPYAGEDLGPRPHVAVIFRDQIGDFLVATPLMRGLRERFPGLTLDYLGGERTREMEEASRLVDARFSLFGAENAELGVSAFLEARRRQHGDYALAVNLEADPRAARACGLIEPQFVVGGCMLDGTLLPMPASGVDGLWHDKQWNRPSLPGDYPQLDTQFIGEIFARLARVETSFTRMEAPLLRPGIRVPTVLLSTGASRGAKLWPAAHWAELARRLRGQEIEVGLLGAAPSAGAGYHAEEVDAVLIGEGVRDLRGALSLPEVAGALAEARAFVTVDNGLMHMAAAVGAPTIALFGASPRRLWAPPVAWVRVLEPAARCTLCEDNHFRNAACLLPRHECMLSIEPPRVFLAVLALLAEPEGNAS